MRDDWERANLDGAALDRHITGNYGEDQHEHTRKVTARMIADDLAGKFHTLMVQASTGGAEQTRAAYRDMALNLRQLAESRYRVTRRHVHLISVWCRNEAAYHSNHGHGEYAGAMERCADIVDAQL